MTWMLFWKCFFVIVFICFLILAILVTIKGALEIKEWLK